MFTSFLFEPWFGVVDLAQNTVHALGSWDTAVTVTPPEDIGALTAEICFAEPQVGNNIVTPSPMFLSQGFGSWSDWWRPKAWARLSSLVPAWLLERLQIWVDVLKMLDEKISQAKVGLARGCSGPKGSGPSESDATAK